jgi:hypothetical protein
MYRILTMRNSRSPPAATGLGWLDGYYFGPTRTVRFEWPRIDPGALPASADGLKTPRASIASM